MRTRLCLKTLVLVGASLFVFGCHGLPMANRLSPEIAGNDADVQMEFWHRLVDRKLTSNDEAFHGLLLFLDGEDPAEDYTARVTILKERNLLSEDFDEPADAAVRRGSLAVAIAHALRIRGGLTMRIFGPTPRYATRELQYLSIYPPSSPHQTFSGAEFLGIMGRVEDYERRFAFKTSASALPGEETSEESTDDQQGEGETTPQESR